MEIRKQVIPFFSIRKIQVQGLAHIRLPAVFTEKVLAEIQRCWTGWCWKLCPVASYTKAFICVETQELKGLNQGQSSDFGQKYKVQQLWGDRFYCCFYNKNNGSTNTETNWIQSKLFISPIADDLLFRVPKNKQQNIKSENLNVEKENICFVFDSAK